MNPNLTISIVSKVFEAILQAWVVSPGARGLDDVQTRYLHAESYGIEPWRYALLQVASALKEIPAAGVRSAAIDQAAAVVIEKHLADLSNTSAIALHAFRAYKAQLPPPVSASTPETTTEPAA